MSGHVEQVSEWVYGGVWGVLTRWFRVPRQPPTLPTLPGETLLAFRPAVGFLRYLKFQFWIALIVIDALLTVGWIAIFIASPWIGVLVSPLALALIIIPDVLAYVAIHLRYDTTWYVMTSRSLRIRRGIWIIHETTITFENVQNVNISQGPLERFFGIANVRVETAGGGGSEPGKGQQHGFSAPHRGLIEGVNNAAEIRDLLLRRLRSSRAAGLGDETPAVDAVPMWTAEHLNVLREIRDLARGMASAMGSRDLPNDTPTRQGVGTKGEVDLGRGKI